MANIEKTIGPGQLETWVARDERAKVCLVPSRGGLVTRYVVDGDEVLYLDEKTLLDPTANVRGGVPQLFPFAGKAPAGSSLGQHGFARKLPWNMVDATADETTARLECELVATDRTRADFPHDFSVRYAVSLADARLSLEWQVTNTGVTIMPLHLGLHPYFRVPLETKRKARVEHRATKAWDNVSGRHVTVPELHFDGPEIDLHLLDHPAQATSLHRGDGRWVHLSWTPGFTTLVLWTQPAKPFICVEPWTAPAGALTSGAALSLMPRQTVRLAVMISLE